MGQFDDHRAVGVHLAAAEAFVQLDPAFRRQQGLEWRALPMGHLGTNPHLGVDQNRNDLALCRDDKRHVTGRGQDIHKLFRRNLWQGASSQQKASI